MNDNPESPSGTIQATRHKLFSSIRGRLFLLLLSVLIPVMFVQVAYTYVRFRKRMEAASHEDAQMSRAVAAALHEFIMGILHQETAIGANLTMPLPIAPGEVKRILKLNKAASPAVRNFAWLDPHGRVTMSSLGSVVGLNLSDRDFVRKIVSGKRWVVSDLLRSRVTGKPVFTVSLAVRGEKGELLGIVVAAIDPEWLENIIPIHPDDDEAITIIDSRGAAVFRAPGVEWSWGRRNRLKNLPAVRQALEGREVAAVIPSYEGRGDRMAAFAPISSIGWTACASRPGNGVTAPIESQAFREGLVFLLVAGAAFLGAFTLSEGISSSIRRLFEHASALGGGGVESELEVWGPGELEGLASAFNTMAEKVRTRESELRAAQQRLITVLEAMPACVFLQAPDRSIVFTNRAFRETFGDPEGKLCYELLMDRTDACENCDMASTLNAQLPRHWERTVPGGKCYSVHTHPFTDADGAPLVLKLAVDISERKLAEEALRESEKQFRGLAGELDIILNSVPAAIWYKDTKNNFIRVNKAAADFAGLGVEEIQGRPAVEIFPLDAETYYRDDWEVISTGKPKLGIIERAVSLSGVERWVRTDKLPMIDANGKITGILAVSIDVTDLRQTQRALRQSESRLRSLSAQLLSAHEEERKRIARELHDSIGSSLTVIKMGLEKTREELKRNGHGPDMLDPLIEWTQLTINEIRRLMSDLRPPVLDDMGVLAALKWFFRQYRQIYPAIHVEAEIGIEEQDIPEPLRIVIFRITQEAFHNIAKHSKAEYVDFSLSNQEGAIRLMIEDNGAGFDLEAVRERQGVGLASMKERAELSGGCLRIRSAPETGTILSAEWPANMRPN